MAKPRESEQNATMHSSCRCRNLIAVTMNVLTTIQRYKQSVLFQMVSAGQEKGVLSWHGDRGESPAKAQAG